MSWVPTQSTSGEASSRGAAAGGRTRVLTPSGVTRTREGGTPSQRTISSREKAESVSTVAALAAASWQVQRRRRPSRGPNHSGCAWNDTSWMVSTVGAGAKTGAE